MTDQILLNFTVNDEFDRWTVDILRETEKGYDYLGALNGVPVINLYSLVTKGVVSNGHNTDI